MAALLQFVAAAFLAVAVASPDAPPAVEPLNAPTPGTEAVSSPAFAECAADTPLTLVGLDSGSGTALFALPGAGAGSSWLELHALEQTAVVYPAGTEVVLGTSSGSGPVFSVLSCGENCLQPARFSAGRFEPLGEALVGPARATVAATYDGGGTPWIVLHEPSGTGVLESRAFRLAGREWLTQGSLRVTDVGHPGAHPVPGDAAAVTSGTGYFSPTAEPRYWLDGLPDVGANRRGEVVALGGELAAYIAADGVVYRSSDRGVTWRHSVWTPWSATVVQAWKMGDDYDAEPPNGSLQLPLPLVWFDHRDPKAATRVLLTEMGSDGAWRPLASLPGIFPGTEPMELSEVVRFDNGSWLLFGGCAGEGDASRVVLQIWRPEKGFQTLALPLTQAPR